MQNDVVKLSCGHFRKCHEAKQGELYACTECGGRKQATAIIKKDDKLLTHRAK